MRALGNAQRATTRYRSATGFGGNRTRAGRAGARNTADVERTGVGPSSTPFAGGHRRLSEAARAGHAVRGSARNPPNLRQPRTTLRSSELDQAPANGRSDNPANEREVGPRQRNV